MVLKINAMDFVKDRAMERINGQVMGLPQRETMLLGIKENLNNIFFLEFDLTKEQTKNLREISNENVERELFFVLNGMIHDVPLFSSDLKFSVETRKFIKSIQFRLETYKNELIQLKKSKSKSETNTTIPVRNTFFGKVLSNTNLGIEFHKPHLYFFI